MKLRTTLLRLALALLPGLAQATAAPVEIHDRIATDGTAPAPSVALTLDACSGRFDAALLGTLVEQRIPATLFVTRKWLLANPQGLAQIRAHLDLFDVEDHGENHIPAVIGEGRKVYGIAGVPDLPHLRREVAEGARSITELVGVAPRWYRGATAEYDAQALREIAQMGYGVAGFSVNADAGATLGPQAVAARVRQVREGDVIIAHMNHPGSGTAAGLSAGLQALQQAGYRFVRLDQVRLRPVP